MFRKLELFGTNEIVFSDDISITEASTIESEWKGMSIQII
jgi:hypothetical protein